MTKLSLAILLLSMGMSYQGLASANRLSQETLDENHEQELQNLRQQIHQWSENGIDNMSEEERDRDLEKLRVQIKEWANQTNDGE